jgi:hypothetical protein
VDRSNSTAQQILGGNLLGAFARIVLCNGLRRRFDHLFDFQTLPSAAAWAAVTWSPEHGVFCMVGNGLYSAVSADGVNWTQQLMAASQIWYCVAWGNSINIFIALPQASTGVVNSLYYWNRGIG